MEKHYKIGLVIGRFQPFHNGHLYLIKEALKLCDVLIIGIGSSNIIDFDNPWNAVQRMEFVQKIILQEKLEDKIIKIVEIPDVPDDDKWYEITLDKVGNFDVSIGNNDWVNGIFKNHNIVVLEIPFFQRYLNEGKKIRELMRHNKSWQDRVPSYLVDSIKPLGI